MTYKYFGISRFSEWAQLDKHSDIWEFVKVPGEFRRLFDHGFIAAKAPVWSDGALEGSEIAIVSRTYCSDNEIDNPPDGLRCWRLPKCVVGDNEPGIAIATVVIKQTTAANCFLTICGRLPSDMMAYAISQEMCKRGYGVLLSPDWANGISARIVRIVSHDRSWSL